MSDADYPTEGQLQALRDWPLNDPRGFLDFAQYLWWMQDWGWPELEGEVSTGGWSGNEDIIDAMQEAQQGLLWHQVWRCTRRGGHYVFSLDEVSGGAARAEPQ